MQNKKHFLAIENLTIAEYRRLFLLTNKLKVKSKKIIKSHILDGYTMAMIFEKPSLRTRVSFETAMTQLGGHAIFLSPNDIQMGKRETPRDVAENLSKMVQIIMARVYEHNTVEELAQNSSCPVINGLSDVEHPCQALADVYTIIESKGSIKGLRIAFVGDGNNNVTHSLALLASRMGAFFVCASPKGYFMNKEVVGSNKNIKQVEDPYEATEGADVVVTDTWISNGGRKGKS